MCSRIVLSNLRENYIFGNVLSDSFNQILERILFSEKIPTIYVQNCQIVKIVDS